MKRCKAAVVATLLFVGGLSSLAAAANLPNSLSITPFAGGYMFEGNQHIADSPVYGLSLGYNLTENWGLELTGTGLFDAKTEGSASPFHQYRWTVYGARADVLYHFFPDKKLVPYVAAGGGLLLLEPRHSVTDHDLQVDYGLGLKYFFTDTYALRADVRHVLDFNVNDDNKAHSFYNNLIYTAGLTFQVGGGRPSLRPAKAEEVTERVVVPPRPAVEPRKPAPPPPPPVVVTPPVQEPVPVYQEQAALLAERKGAANPPAGKVMVTGIAIDQNALEIVATKRIRDYRVFTLSQPSRLVIDIQNGINGLDQKKIEVNKFGIASVRLGNNSDHLRVVLDATQGQLLPYRVVETDKGLKVIVTNP